VVVVYLGVYSIFIIIDTFSLLSLTRGYVYLQCNYSFQIFVCSNYVCEIVQVYLVICLSFHCVVFLIFGRLCHMRLLCRVYVERILSCLFL
jgi:hypothetical protein